MRKPRAEPRRCSLDGFGWSVAGAGQVEEREQVCGALDQRSPERDELGRGSGNAAAQGVDDGAHQRAALGVVFMAVGGDHALVDAPGGLDRGVLVDGERHLNTSGMLVGKQAGAGVQGPPSWIERVARSAAVAVQILLNSAVGAVQGLTGQAHDMEGGHHAGRVGPRFGGGGLETGEAVHRHDFHPMTPGLRTGGQPLLEDLLRSTFDHVQQARRAGAVTDRGQVDDHGHILVALAGLALHVLVNPDRGHAVEAGRITDQETLAFGQEGVVRGVHATASAKATRATLRCRTTRPTSAQHTAARESFARGSAPFVVTWRHTCR